MKKALCVLLSVVMLLSMSVTAFAADTKGAPSQTLPSWLPDDAPAPDPNFVIIRAISDKADDSAQIDYPVFEKAAALHSARLVEHMLPRI